MTVYLVGAGPGDPGLLTVRGAEVLARADVVLYDRLVAAEMLDLAPREALRIDVGKTPGDSSPHRQSEINELLVRHARSAATVVRLKGGDPFVFGRGGEEAEALLAAGVDFEVVPGVSSAFSVPALAGVPVTHRGLARSVTVVTGHVGDDRDGPSERDPDWEVLARAGGTLVVMMGMQNREEIARRLVSAGRSPATPVLVVHQGSTALQRSERCTLGTLSEVVLDAPSIIVIGEVAALRMAGEHAGPLNGLSVVLTRPVGQSSRLASALAAAGAKVVALPVIAIGDPADGGVALRRAACALSEHRFEWVVFASANAVDRLLCLVRDVRDLAGTRFGVVGRATAAALARHGIVADLVPDVSSAAGLVDAMAPAPTGEGAGVRANRVLFARAEEALDVLAPGLRAKGWEVDEVVAYRTVAATASDGLSAEALDAASRADAITFTSPSTVRHYLQANTGRPLPRTVVCIGPTTADAARAAGLKVDVVAADQSAEGMVDALAAHVSQAGTP